MKCHTFFISIAVLMVLSVKLVLASSDSQLVSSRNTSIYTNSSDEQTKVLSRRKRFIAFPEGSTFSIAFCASIGYIGNPEFDYMSWALNWGLAYDLPNETWVIEELHKNRHPRPLIQRRHRRELYRRIELAIDKMGYNGRDCILRALCESPQYFYRHGSNMIEEMLRTIFFLPSMKLLPFEHPDLVEYSEAHRKGRNRAYCAGIYPQCSFSIIGLILGETTQSLDYM